MSDSFWTNLPILIVAFGTFIVSVGTMLISLIGNKKVDRTIEEVKEVHKTINSNLSRERDNHDRELKSAKDQSGAVGELKGAEDERERGKEAVEKLVEKIATEDTLQEIAINTKKKPSIVKKKPPTSIIIVGAFLAGSISTFVLLMLNV